MLKSTFSVALIAFLGAFSSVAQHEVLVQGDGRLEIGRAHV